MSAEPRHDESADASTARPRVDYFYDEGIGNYEYGRHHPMRPHRVRMTHHLVVNYGLYKQMNIFRPKPATYGDLTTFHSDEYINFLRTVTPENMEEPNFRSVLERFNICDDCPIFDGLYEYCQAYTGGSIGGAARINQGCSDIVINWAGGLHHAKRGEASGFCYTNDIVLAILELLKVHARVLYIDIDIHHGDGVEEAFYLTNRVLTLSFHASHDTSGTSFFPRTGHINDTGGKAGKNYSVNFPMFAGVDDVAYESIFKPVIRKIMEKFQPSVVVFCCGADSLSGDRVGCWNLSIKGHAAVLEFVKTFNLPMLVLGGGGYSIRNVARCWCYETSRLLGTPIADQLPWHEFMDYYLPDYKLHVPVSNMRNENTPEQLEARLQKVLENLSQIECAPNVQMHHAPNALDPGADSEEDEEEAINADRRRARGRRPHMAEYFDDDETVADRMISGRMGLDSEDIGETLSCGCVDECECRPPNPFVASLRANGR